MNEPQHSAALGAPAIHTRAPALVLRAGHKAAAHIRAHGLKAADVALLPGAAGGPKGIGLLGLDRAVFGHFLPQVKRTRTLVGASVGCWRFAAVAAGGTDPQQQVASLERLARLYSSQRFPKGMRPADVSRQCQAMLDELLDGRDQTLLTNPDYRLVVIADRCRHLFASDQPLVLITALLALVASNLLSRKSMALFTERALLAPGSAPLPLREDGFRSHHLRLDATNLRAALMASASIPLVLAGVRDMAGAPAGTYRDGGLLDYHLDLPWQTDELVLYPHFAERVTPGWFDKPLKWRHADRERFSNTLLVAPSADYLAHLPHGKLPSRDDFKRYAGDDVGRERYWQKAIAESDRLGDEFLELVESKQLADRLIDY